MIKAVIFDCGGVLKVGADDLLYHDMARSFGMDFDEIKQAVRAPLNEFETGKIDEVEFWKRVGQNTGKPLPHDHMDLWTRQYLATYEIRHDVLDLAKALRSRGYAVPLLSNTVPGHAEINKKNRLYDLFEPVLLSHEIGFKKPDPETYVFTLERIGYAANECVLIDDKERNIAPAQSVGMHTILFTDRSSLERELSTLGVEFQQ
jgi:epoxide hydrolase-like predicted phosphatase